MEQIVIKVIEASITGAALFAVLWVFLPRLLSTIDAMDRRNVRDHTAISMMILNLATRLNYHEAKVYGINPSLGSENERIQAANESFRKACDELEQLRRDLQSLYHTQDISNG